MKTTTGSALPASINRLRIFSNTHPRTAMWCLRRVPNLRSPLATLRAQNQLIEIDAAALRFDMQETQAFFERTRPGALALADVQLLQRKTEGWPAALRIIASMASQSGPDLKDYVRNLSGSQRPIAAYFVGAA